MMACKKNDPITELGDTNNEFVSELRVTYNNTALIIGDTLVISASTWQKDDKFKKVDIYETLVESFGIDMTLTKGSAVVTKTTDESTLTVVDTLSINNVLKEVLATDMDQYWVTVTNNYVINQNYIVKVKPGKYANDITLIDKLPAESFDVLKSILAYSISKSDYLLLFPAAPVTDFTGEKLSSAGMINLRMNLTKAKLVPIVKTIKKIANYTLTIDVASITPTNAATLTTKNFNIKL